MVGYIFGGETGETPESLKRKRDIAAAMLGRSSTPKNVGEGLNAIGNAIVYRAMMNGVEKGEAAGRKSADEAFAPISNLLGGGSSTPSPVPMTGAANEVSSTSPSIDLSGDKQGFIDGLLPAAVEESKRTGVDPRIIVAQAAQETGWGKSAPGNNFFGIKSHGQPGGNNLMTTEYVNGSPVRTRDSFRAFNSPTDSVRGYGDFILQNPRYTNFRNAQGLDAQLDELGKSGYATDPNYAQSIGSIARSIKLPTQVASLDPAAGLSHAPVTPPAAPTPGYVDPKVVNVSRSPTQGPSQPAPPLPPPTTVANAPQVAAQPPVAPTAQVAQAMSTQQPSSIDLGAVTKALNNPFLSPGQRAVAQSILQQEMERRNAQYEMQLKQSDPAYKQDLEKGAIELENLRNPKISPTDQANIDLNREKFDFERNKPLSVGEGNTVIRPDGKVIFQAPQKPAPQPSAVLEYEYAKGQGFPGTFQDWEASKKGGMSLQVDPATGAVTFQQGGNIKPMTEGQSKDAVFSTRAAGALPLIDKFGESLTGTEGVVGGTIGQLPVVGNFAKSEGYQQAEQAGKEFLQAILRKDTGAAITKEETAEYGSVYLPRPGDSKDLLTQKKASRVRALEAIKAGMPPQAILAQEKALLNTAKATDTPPEGIDPEDWKFMDEGQRKLFR